MKALISLFFQKKKANIRNLYSKPSSAIMITCFILLYVGVFVFSFLKEGKESMGWVEQNILATLVIFVMGGFCLLMLMQKREALFFLEDSYYLFIGPFSNKQIIFYMVFDSMFTSFLIALVALMLVAMVAMVVYVPVYYLIHVVLVSTWMIFITSISIIIPYFKSLISGKKSKYKRRMGSILISLIIIIMGFQFLVEDLNIKASMMQILTSNMFYYIPIIGWGKYTLIATFTNDLIGMLVGYGLLIGGSIILTYILIHIKGYFYEQAMIDSANFTEYYQQVRDGKNGSVEKSKLYHTDLSFKVGEFALYSKNLLMLLKTRSLVKVSDFLWMLFVIGYAIFMELGIEIYVLMSLSYTFSGIKTEKIVEELQHHYVYLIPGSAYKKLLAIILIPIFKACFLVFLGIIIANIFLFQLPLHVVLLYSFLSWTFIVLFVMGHIVGIYVFGTGKEQWKRSLVSVLIAVFAIAISCALSYLYFIITNNMKGIESIVILSMMTINIVFSICIYVLCAPLLNGREVD